MKDSDSYPPDEMINSETGKLECDVRNDVSTDGVEREDEMLWNGEEAEIVADDEAEEYEEETTGIKIKYFLDSDKVYGFIRRSKMLDSSLKLQRKHTIIQLIVLTLILIVSMAIGKKYYLWFALFPIAMLVFLNFVPLVGIKRMVSRLFMNRDVTLEIFPDKIDVIEGTAEREILLDGSYELEENNDFMALLKDGIIKLVIPINAIEPEFRADVQAMILAGVKDK